jgi:hypothetical protein
VPEQAPNHPAVETLAPAVAVNETIKPGCIDWTHEAFRVP